MKIVEGNPLDVKDLFVGRLIVLSNMIVYCPNCKSNFAQVGHSLGEVTKIISDTTYEISYKYNFPSCPTCKCIFVGTTFHQFPKEEQRKKHQEILHKSGALN